MLEIVKKKCKECDVENMNKDKIKHKKSSQKNMRCMVRWEEYFRPQNFREQMGKFKI